MQSDEYIGYHGKLTIDYQIATAMIKEYDHLYKTVIIGNSGVGKSSILIRFAENQFQQHYLATIGVDFRFKTTIVDGKNVKFQIWDTAGQERFRTITSAYYRGSQAILLVFDVTDQQSFNDITKFWMGEVEQYAEKDALLLLIGNKSDLVDHRKVSAEEIKAYTTNKKMIYVQCSAKEDDRIKDIFAEMARTLMKREDMKNMPIAQPKKGKGLTKEDAKPAKKSCC